MSGTPRGALVVVGIGMRLGAQFTPEARTAIADSDVVFAVSGDPVTEAWLRRQHANVVSLHHCYLGRTRSDAYDLMTAAIVAAVRDGAHVCAVFYGHPGVFVLPSHAAIAQLRKEGFDAFMLPGVSAEACLIADLGVDPGQLGWQSYEATDFIMYGRRIDPTAALVLWQIAVAGDLSFEAFAGDARGLAFLAEVLMESYPASHEIVIYEAATLPTTRPRMDRMTLTALAVATVSQESSLFVPPLAAPTLDTDRLARLRGRLR